LLGICYIIPNKMNKEKQMSNRKDDHLRIRRFWTINPVERIHGEGKKQGYNRNIEKRKWRKEME